MMWALGNNLRTFLFDIENILEVAESDLRKKDGKVQRGDCELEFNQDTFQIKQDNEIIENNIDSIYYVGLWHYEEYDYIKIVMRSHKEYKFSLINNQDTALISYFKLRDIKVEDNR